LLPPAYFAAAAALLRYAIILFSLDCLPLPRIDVSPLRAFRCLPLYAVLI